MGQAEGVRAALNWQAGFCRDNGSPGTGRICAALAAVLDDSTETGRRALAWKGDAIAEALPLRLAGALHALYRGGRAPALAKVYAGEEGAGAEAAVRATVAGHDAEIAGWLDGPPQTNEPGRAAALMAGLLAIAAIRPEVRGFEILEIGSSAGLNLMLGRYAYDLGGVKVGPQDAPVRLVPEWRGPPPPDTARAIESTCGVDIAPIDLSDPAQAERLIAYIWAGQTERLERTAAAIRMAQAHPPHLDKGDAAGWLKARLEEPQAEGVARVLMHSVVWPYLPVATQQEIESLMSEAGARADAGTPLCWLSYENWSRETKAHELHLRSWPGAGAGAGMVQPLAFVHPHGAWIDWRPDAPSGAAAG